MLIWKLGLSPQSKCYSDKTLFLSYPGEMPTRTLILTRNKCFDKLKQWRILLYMVLFPQSSLPVPVLLMCNVANAFKVGIGFRY